MPLLYRLLVAVDVWVLLRVKRSSEWLTEWLSVSQRVQERCLIVGYALFCLSGLVGTKMNPWMGVLLFCILYNTRVLLWSLHRESAQQRIRRLLSTSGMLVRVIVFFLLASEGVLLSCLPPHGWHDLCNDLGCVCFLATLYLTAITTEGQRGRRRRLAADKVKALFGTSWMPAPVAVPR